MSEVVVALDRDEARRLTDEVRSDAEALWFKMLRLYNGRAHSALGYGSWGDYYESEFGGSKSHGYRLLDAARVVSSFPDRGIDPPRNEWQARELVPLLARDEVELVAAWREVKDAYGDKATAVNVKQVVTNRLERIKREEEAITKRLELAEAVIDQPDDDVWIEHGSFDDVLDEYDLFGAVVISDPPYPREYLPAWEQLADWGLRAGIKRMVLMAGQTILPDVLRIFADAQYLYSVDDGPETWQFRWCAAYLTSGPATRVWNANVGTSWKPVLVFDRGDEREFVTRDVFESSGDDKRFHYWGQNEQGFAQLVDAFSNPGELVVDPFVGGGTTAIVCRDLGRRFVGADIDKAAVNATLERLAA